MDQSWHAATEIVLHDDGSYSVHFSVPPAKSQTQPNGTALPRSGPPPLPKSLADESEPADVSSRFKMSAAQPGGVSPPSLQRPSDEDESLPETEELETDEESVVDRP